MYELVTGHVPFKGENPVEVAIKHMNEEIPSICEYDPDMPQSIENIILKAAAKNPKNRYASANEMHEDLKTALNEERFNEPKVIYEYKEKNFDDDLSIETPRRGRTVRNAEQTEEKNEKKVNKAIIILGSIIAVLGLIASFLFFVYPNIAKNKSARIPDVGDMTVKQAKTILEDKGFTVNKKTKKENSEDIEEGKVIGTDPKIGKSIKISNKITLIISKGSQKIVIEDYKGQNYEKIKEKLEDAGINVITESKDVSSNDNVKEDTIIEQSVKPGEKLGKGDTITLTIPNLYISYPNFTDGTYTVEDIKKFCTDNGLTLDITYVEDEKAKNGDITYQNMTSGSKVSKGANLRIKVVQNKEKVPTDETEIVDTSNVGEKTE